MDREKMIARYYLDTGILGAYETTGNTPPALKMRW